MKRFHHLPQVHLGAAFGWSIPMAFAGADRHGPGSGLAAVRGERGLVGRL